MSFYPNFISILSRCYPNLFKVSFWNLDETVSTLSQFYPNFFWPNSLYSYFIQILSDFFQIFYPDYVWSFDGIESYFMDLVGKTHQFSGYFFRKKSCKKKVHYAIWTINQFWKKKISTKNEKWKKIFLFYINRLWFRVPHGLSGAFIRHYTSRPLVLPYLWSLRPHKWLHLASTSTCWVSNGILFRKLFWPTVRKNCLPKGKIISKGLLVSTNSPKKRTNKFVFTTTTN